MFIFGSLGNKFADHHVRLLILFTVILNKMFLAKLDSLPFSQIFLDGPYGAPSSHIFRAQHAVLIATGIGVTPFASILQSIMHRYWKARHTCPKCKFSWACDIPATVMNLRKVIIWDNQKGFWQIIDYLILLRWISSGSTETSGLSSGL